MSDLLNLSEIQPTKTAAAILANNIVSIVTNGNVSPLDAMAKTKCLLIALEEAESQIKPLALEELNRSPEKSIEFKGAKFEKCEIGGKWNYDNCNDAVYIGLKEKLAEREKFLKAIPTSGFETVDTATGEVIILYPPTKIGSVSTFKTTLGK
jgi:hypothetical protein